MPSPPGPDGYPLLGVFPIARRDPLRFFSDAARAYGDVVSLPMGRRRLYLLGHPDHIEHVLRDGDRVYEKAASAALIRPLFGSSLTTVDGEPWRWRRRSMGPAFHPGRLASLIPAIALATNEMLDRWDSSAAAGRPIDVLDEMTDLTRAVILHALFGSATASESQSLGDALGTVITRVNQGLWSPLAWLDRFPTTGAWRYRRALAALDVMVSRRIAEGCRSRASTGDLLRALLEARDGAGGRWTDAELCDEVKALLVAGHTTTASALAWACSLLAQDREVARRLAGEAHRVLGPRAPMPVDLPALEQARKVAAETLRLYPPTWVTARTPTSDVSVGGYRIPAGAIVLLSPYVTHRDARFWPNPERFDPERFALGGSSGRPRFAYFPFGGGPRACIGSALAAMEMQLVLAMTARRYRLSLAAGCRVEPDPGIALRPRHGLVMTPHRAERPDL